ncbi:MAG: histidine kinase dimerization/phosphoacceptor domain -containing protein [Rhizomicrobium sp.]
MAPHTPPHSDIALDLALAVIASSDAPLLLLNSALTVVAASRSFCRVFQIDPAAVQGRALAELGAGEWNILQLSALLRATASGYAEVQDYEMDLKREGRDDRSLIINAHKLDYTGGTDARLILAVSDVTDARTAEKLRNDLLRDKDALLKDKAVLLQELQHRVANSLQIIASVLMQSARKVQSEETRTHLFDAHQRVMSVAALQQHLAASTAGDVTLRPYLTVLCESIGASMIRDHSKLSLEVDVDDSTTSADVSVSLGLIVTELVINALKHAFPNDSSGRIKVDYNSHGPNWTLSVSDTGVGMPKNAVNPKPGLGTNIVQALAGQLQATIKVAEAHPGTMVSIVHSQIAAVQSAAAMPGGHAI